MGTTLNMVLFIVHVFHCICLSDASLNFMVAQLDMKHYC